MLTIPAAEGIVTQYQMAAVSLHHEVQHLAFIIDSAPQVHAYAADGAGHLVQVPAGGQGRSFFAADRFRGRDDRLGRLGLGAGGDQKGGVAQVRAKGADAMPAHCAGLASAAAWATSSRARHGSAPPRAPS